MPLPIASLFLALAGLAPVHAPADGENPGPGADPLARARAAVAERQRGAQGADQELDARLERARHELTARARGAEAPSGSERVAAPRAGRELRAADPQAESPTRRKRAAQAIPAAPRTDPRELALPQAIRQKLARAYAVLEARAAAGGWSREQLAAEKEHLLARAQAAAADADGPGLGSATDGATDRGRATDRGWYRRPAEVDPRPGRFAPPARGGSAGFRRAPSAGGSRPAPAPSAPRNQAPRDAGRAPAPSAPPPAQRPAPSPRPAPGRGGR